MELKEFEHPVDTYQQAVDFLFGRINYERIHAGRYTTREFKLDRMRRLLALLGDPHERLPVVHVAGTKGKGSTAAMTAAILSAAGYRTGLFTSPHISRFEERMQINGVSPGPDQFVALTRRVAQAIELLERPPHSARPTYFEVATAIAWLYFVQAEAELAVLEVGVGGRLDATNICRPQVAVITNISYDHTQLLGNTLEQIAAEKAGIIKPGCPVVSGVEQPEVLQVVSDACRRNAVPLWLLDRDFLCRTRPAETEQPLPLPRLKQVCIDVEVAGRRYADLVVPLPGVHQARNAALAVAAVDLLRQRGWEIPPSAVPAGLRRVHWPLRAEIVACEPLTVLDAAHNVASMEALMRTFLPKPPGSRSVLIFAGTRDKDVAGMLRIAAPEFDEVILTQYVTNPRAVPLEELSELLPTNVNRPVHVAATPTDAWTLARNRTGPADLICATGSFFLAAELRELIRRQAETRSDALPVEPALLTA